MGRVNDIALRDWNVHLCCPAMAPGPQTQWCGLRSCVGKTRAHSIPEHLDRVSTGPHTRCEAQGKSHGISPCPLDLGFSRPLEGPVLIDLEMLKPLSGFSEAPLFSISTEESLRQAWPRDPKEAIFFISLLGTAKPTSRLHKHQAGGSLIPSARWAEPAGVPQSCSSTCPSLATLPHSGTSPPGTLALQGSPLLPGVLPSSYQGSSVGCVSGGSRDAAYPAHSPSCPGRRPNPMTSCLWLFPSGTAVTMTFMVCATWLVP